MATEFDFEQLDAITGGDMEFEREVLVEYLASAPSDIARIEQAVGSGDGEAAAAAAHALKGSSSTIGAKGFAAIAQEIESAGKKGDLSSAPAALVRMHQAFGELGELLQARLSKTA